MDILIFPLNHTASASLAELEKSCFSDPWTVGMFRDSFNDPLTRCFGASLEGGTPTLQIVQEPLGLLHFLP